MLWLKNQIKAEKIESIVSIFHSKNAEREGNE